MERITAAEMARYLAIDRRGQFFAQMAPGEWMGLDNRDGVPAMFRGSLRDVLEVFVPWTGETRQANDVPGVLGITRTAESMVRFPLVKAVKGKRKNGIRKTTIRKESA
jgi:hypothetical protein